MWLRASRVSRLGSILVLVTVLTALGRPVPQLPVPLESRWRVRSRGLRPEQADLPSRAGAAARSVLGDATPDGAWTQPPVPLVPDARSGQSVAWNPAGWPRCGLWGMVGRDRALQRLVAVPASQQYVDAGGAPAARCPPHGTITPRCGTRPGAQLLVFGGFNVRSYPNLFNDLWSYQARTNSWTQLSPSGTPPRARLGHAAVWDTAGNRLLVFGGQSQDPGGLRVPLVQRSMGLRDGRQPLGSAHAGGGAPARAGQCDRRVGRGRAPDAGLRRRQPDKLRHGW